MPIKDPTVYPKDWKQIRNRILARAGNCCEGSPAYPDCRVENGQRHPKTGSKVVLTVAHLVHGPDHSDGNLRAWCQRCHLTYDAGFHARNARRTIRGRKAIGDLFPMERL